MTVMDRIKEGKNDDAKKGQAPPKAPAQAVAPLKAEPERSATQPPAVPQAKRPEEDAGGRVATPRKATDENGKHPEQYLDAIVVSPEIAEDQKAAAGNVTIPPKPPTTQPPKWKKYARGITWGTVLAGVLSLGVKLSWDLFLEGVFNKYDVGGKVGNVINKVPNHFTRQDIWDAVAEEQKKNARFKKKVGADVAEVLETKELVQMESSNGYPTFRPPVVMADLKKAEKDLGKNYETLRDEGRNIELVKELLRTEKDDAKKKELEKELLVLQLGENIENVGYNLKKMKFSTKPVPDIMAELEKAEKALGESYGALQNEGRTSDIVRALLKMENNPANKEKLGKELLVLQLGEEFDNRLKMEKLIFKEKKKRNVSVEKLCGNTMVGVEVKDGDKNGAEYPTAKVCDVKTWNIVDVDGNLLEVVVYDDHILCPDDCGKKGKGVKKESDVTVINIGGNI